jgi:hypothetical protein
MKYLIFSLLILTIGCKKDASDPARCWTCTQMHYITSPDSLAGTSKWVLNFCDSTGAQMKSYEKTNTGKQGADSVVTTCSAK